MRKKWVVAVVTLFINVSIGYSYNDYANSAYEISNDNYISYNNNYKDYSNFNFFDFTPSKFGLFTIDVRDWFDSNEMFDGVRHSWQMNDYSLESGESYLESYNTFVAPNVEPIDYCGIVIKDNNKWGSFSYGNNLYEPQWFSNVKMYADGKAYKSFEVLIGKEGINTRNVVDDIVYNEENFPESLCMTTRDIAGNEYTQEVSDISYQENPQYVAYTELMDLCDINAERDNYYLWGELQNQLQAFAKPAKYVVESFSIQLTKTESETTKIKIEKVKWDPKGVVGFVAKILDVSKKFEIKLEVFAIFEGKTINGFKVKLNTPQGMKELLVDDQKELSNIVAEYIPGLENPIELIKATNIQIGEAKIPLFPVKYNDKALLDKGSKKYEIDCSINKLTTVENSLINEIYQLLQTDEKTATEIIWDRKLNSSSEKELEDIRDEIKINVVQEFENLSKQKEIKTAWGDRLPVKEPIELRLQANKIKTAKEFKTVQGTYSKVTLIIAKGELLVAGAKLKKANGVEQYIGTSYEPKDFAPIKGVDNANYKVGDMQTYAKKWSQTVEHSKTNSKYTFFPKRNCTNFISQCLTEAGFPLQACLTSEESAKHTSKDYGDMVTYCDSLDIVLCKNAGVVRSFIKFSEEYLKKGKKDFYSHEVFKSVKVGDVIILGKDNDGKLEKELYEYRYKNEFSHAGIVTKMENNIIYISTNTRHRHNQSLTFFFTRSAFNRAYIYNLNRRKQILK